MQCACAKDNSLGTSFSTSVPQTFFFRHRPDLPIYSGSCPRFLATMSYTATATRGVAPTSLNLNVFSHPPRFEKQKPKSPAPSAFTDDEDIFSLDMVTMDMDFDQAYSMYTQMQQKNAISGVEQLQKAQQQNMYPQAGLGGMPLLAQPNQMMNGGLFAEQLMTSVPYEEEDKLDDEFDQFFSNTETNALEKFLDNLALSLLANPLELYNQPQHKMVYDLHTMGSSDKPSMPARDIPDYVKKEITDAFRHVPVQNLKSFGQHQQLPTPLDLRNSSTHSEKRRASSMEALLPSWSPSLEKRRRSSTKPLLTLEQKRLNHSHSEQKRRVLCKQAYERCLRLITNVEDYKNDLVSASAVTSSKKKSKRKQINKDGLPNLLKHTALLKISNEILKIRGKNDQLRKLIEQY